MVALSINIQIGDTQMQTAVAVRSMLVLPISRSLIPVRRFSPYLAESLDITKCSWRNRLPIHLMKNNNFFVLLREEFNVFRICRSDFDRHLCDLLEHLNLWTQVQQSYVQLWKKQEMPTPADLVHAIKDLFERPGDDDVTVIMEPGRSIVGNISALLTTVLGCKSSGQTRFVVVDGAMTEVIRPSLYGAYHHIQLAGPPSSVSETKTNVTRIGSGLSARDAEVCSADHTNEEICDTGRIKIDVVDVVGPVCESGDFLGKDRLLPRPQPGACVVVRDVGAYCSSMASNYNLRMRPAEVLVEGATWRLIRKPDTLEDLLKFYQIDSVDS